MEYFNADNLIARFEEIANGCDSIVEKFFFDGVLAVLDTEPRIKGPEWRNANDDPPDDCVEVIVYDKDAKCVTTGYKSDGYFNLTDHDWNKRNITHWMPMPEPPKEEKEDALWLMKN